MKTPTIWVDADACPVRSEIEKVAERYGLSVVYVAASGLRPSRYDLASIKLVGGGFDEADDYIAENIAANDLCITADMPLAARCVERKALALTPKGRLLDQANVGGALAARNLSQHLREANQSQTYNAPFGKADRSQFLQVMDRAIRQLQSTSQS
ncbi:YaiI/YqxD family protein [Notoacmeibacter sp. MSK16QG-6]|uniref:YaiI/YqxD family protein n=1 Tax=Notoacmeibacter sp. MSK16QG-6 TaxID=2957982 RepID=UPI0035309184